MPSVTIYFDYTDPWCYIAVFRAEWLKSRRPGTEVRWHPFEVFPDVPVRGARPRNPAFLRRKIQYDVDELTRDLPVTIVVPRDRVTNSRQALAGCLIARDTGCFEAYHRGMFRAYFEQARDIGQIDTVVAVAGEAGADAERVRRALEDGRYGAEIARLREEAAQQGVVAVPTFVADRRAVVGIVRDDNLLRILPPETEEPVEE